MKNLNANVMNRVNTVSSYALARNAFAGFFGFVYFYFYFFTQTMRKSLTRPAEC